MNGFTQRLVLVGLLAVASGAARGEPIRLVLTVGFGETMTDRDGFQFDASGRLVLDRVSSPHAVEAGTADGRTHFGGAGLPLVLPVPGGRAYVTSGGAPDALTGDLDGLSPEVPAAADSVPATAPRLSVDWIDGRQVDVMVTDGTGATLGEATAAIPLGGWWVIDLAPSRRFSSEPIVSVRTNEPAGVPVPAGVPEPATALLVVVGVGVICGWSRFRRLHQGERRWRCTTSN